MVLGLGEHDAFGCHERHRCWLARLEGHLHRLHQRLAEMPDHQPSGRLRLGIQTKAREHVLDDAHVILRPLEESLLLLLEVLVDDAAKGGLVDLHTAEFRSERAW